MKKILLTFVILVLTLISYGQQRYYVKTTGNDAYNGNSWNTAFKTVQHAINVANARDEIWVAQGTYRPAVNSSFSMKEGVKIYGGFVDGDLSLADQNRDSKVTILEGNGSSVIYNVDNHLTREALLDGFHIRNGTGVLASGIPVPSGGGILNIRVSPSINNCVIEYCTATSGAGIGNYYSNALYTNLIVRNNTGRYDGGGIHDLGNHNTFGGIYENILCENNIVTERAGGGLMNYSSTIAIKNCIFRGNKAARGGGIFLTLTTKCQYRNLQITGNVATNSGGGIFSENNEAFFLTNVTIAGNFAQNQGGGWSHVNDGSNRYNEAFMHNSIIWGNRTSQGNNNLYFRNQANNRLTFGWNLIESFANLGLANYPTFTDEGGNFNGNPLFVDYQTATSINTPVISGDFHLTASSDAYNKGKNEISKNFLVDLDGFYRIYCGYVDLGCYELQECCEILCVDLNNNAPIQDGFCWETAFSSLHSALNYARHSSCVREIWVAGGTYMGSNYRMVSNVTLKGGYISGTDVRDIAGNPTILKKQYLNEAVIINNNFSNNNRLLNAVLDGFTLTSGTTTNINIVLPIGDDGGAMNNRYSEIEIRNCNINNNKPGIANYDSDVTLLNCNITNHASDAIRNYTSTVAITDCNITDNTALYGGGVYNSSSSVVNITNCNITNNIAKLQGGGVYNLSSSVNITNCNITDNTAVSTAGTGKGGGVYNRTNSTVAIYGCNILRNKSNDGGGVYIEESYTSGVAPTGSYRFERVNISNNHSSNHGGGIYNKYGSLTLVNVLLTSNLAEGSGGGIYSLTGTGQIVFTTISGNRAINEGGAIFSSDTHSDMNRVILIDHSIVWMNRIGCSTSPMYQFGENIKNDYVNSLQFRNSLIWQSFPRNNIWYAQFGVNLGYNLDVNPLFVSPVLATCSNYQSVGDFHLTNNSPAKDAAQYISPSIYVITDLDGNRRLYGTAYDMGCYEYRDRSSGQPNNENSEDDILSDHRQDYENLINSDYKIYPNPVSDILKIECGALRGDEKIFITDALGKVVLESKLLSENYELNVSHLKPGVYFVQIISNSKSFTTKVIKN